MSRLRLIRDKYDEFTGRLPVFHLIAKRKEHMAIAASTEDWPPGEPRAG